MTLREAIEEVESWKDEYSAREWGVLIIILEAAKQQADDTVEIVTLTEAKK